MRFSVAAACLFLCLIGFSSADDAQASVRKETNIPAEGLGPALKALAKDRDFQIVYVTEEIANVRTEGAVGELTTEEALKRLLAGTGLTYRYLDDKTVTIGPATAPYTGGGSQAAPTASDGSSANQEAANQEAKKSSSGGLRVAQLDQGKNSSGVSVASQTSNPQESASGASVGLSEIVITAQKRSEPLSKAPLAVSVLDMDQLQVGGVVNIKDLTSTVPNVQIHTEGLDSFVGINIRGVSNYDYSGTSDPAVSTYIDGVYVGQSQGFGSELYDVERIEVLRGPQGTLYGRNATGGNVNVLTTDPKDTFAASTSVSYGNYNDVQIQGMVNIPISDQLKIRAAFMTHRNDGYFDTQGTTSRNYGAADDFGARFTALLTPTDAFKWRLSFDEFYIEGTPWASIDTGPDGKPVNGLPVYEQPTSSSPEPSNYIRSWTIRSRMDWNIADSLTASYVAGYQSIDTHYAWATTGEPSAPADPGWTEYSQAAANSQSHELDLNYEGHGLKNVFGGSFYRQVGPTDHGVGVFNAYDDYFVGNQADPGVRKTAWGIFEQATYSLVDRLRITGGVRYSDETQFANLYDIFYCPISANPGLNFTQVAGLRSNCPGYFAAPSPAGSASWSNVSWKAGIEGDINATSLAYASVTTGFKSGGLQLSTVPGKPSSYSPEEVTNYELGLKTRMLDDSANVRAALFYEDYKDLQVAQLLGAILETTNAAKARIYGIELESEWNITPVDQIRGFANYLHATYTDYTNASNPLVGLPDVTEPAIATLNGNQLPNAPQESLRFQYSHDFPLPNHATLTPEASVYWQSVSYLSPFNEGYYRVAPYSKTDLNLTYTDSSGRWKVTAFGHNLENNAVRVGQFTGAGVYSDFAPPRLFGIRISYQP